MSYSFLSPVTVGPFRLKNRIIRPAITEYIANDDGTVSDQYVEFYRNIARGGVSLIVPGISVIDETVQNKGHRTPHLTDERFIPGLERTVRAVHEFGAKIFFQLWHSGHYLSSGRLIPMVNDLTLEEIGKIKQKYLKAAEIVKAAGADGVEFHIAHTFLPSQFLSPHFNKRTDEYGSNNIENAMRFSRECMELIRDKLLDDRFAMIVKLSGSDFFPDGITPDWAGQASAIAEKAGASMFTVNGGGALAGYNNMSDNGRRPEGWKVHLAEAVKKYVSVPVAASGNIRSPYYAHSLIQDKRCDLIALGRTILAEPEWVKKVSEGRENELRSCISCLYCFTPVPDDDSVPGCSVNPYCKCERSKPALIKNGAGRRVAVVGAGPSGLEAAVVLAERGFKVTVFEKKPYIGGLVKIAAVPPYKSKLGFMLEYYENQLSRLGVDLRLCSECTLKDLEALEPYAVFLATGSNEFVPEIPGTTGENVLPVRRVLEAPPAISGKSIVVAGGGATGVETAHMLALKGNTVTCIDMLPNRPLPLADRLRLEDAENDGVKLLYSHKLTKVAKGYVTAEDLSGHKEVNIPADMVVTALGLRANKALNAEVSAKFERSFFIGDCGSASPMRIATAVRDGAEAAYALE